MSACEIESWIATIDGSDRCTIAAIWLVGAFVTAGAAGGAGAAVTVGGDAVAVESSSWVATATMPPATSAPTAAPTATPPRNRPRGEGAGRSLGGGGPPHGPRGGAGGRAVGGVIGGAAGGNTAPPGSGGVEGSWSVTTFKL